MIKFIKSSQGFGLIGILIVMAVIALAGGGGLYLNETKKQQSLFETGADAIKRTEELKKQIESRQEQIYGGRTSINSSKESLDATQNYTAYNSEESFGGINMGDSIFLNWYIVPDDASKIRFYRSLSSQGPWIRVRDYPVDMLKYGPVDGVDGTKADLYYKAEAISPSEAVLKEYGVLRIPKYIDEYGDLKSSKIDTSTWKTYRNEKYGFEVKYPPKWSERENLIGDFGVLFQASISGQKFYEFTIIVVSRDREDYLNLSKRFSKVQERSIDNIVCEVSPEMFNYDQTTYFILCRKNNFIYSVGFPNGEKNKENPNIVDSITNAKIAEQILTTFKFIK